MGKYKTTYKETYIWTIIVDAKNKTEVKERVINGLEDSQEPIEFNTYGTKFVSIEKIEE
jgi:hypothetical protein